MFRNIRKSFKSKKGAEDPQETEGSARPGLKPVNTAISAYPSSATELESDSLSSAPTLAVSNRHLSRSDDRKNEPLGLHVLYEPEGPHTLDIIFVHGLGGTSRLSWSWNRDLSYFWPQEWLPQEPEMKDARILTFGYNAHFMSQKGDIFNISDFAKDLLLQMKFGSDANVKALDIGKVPILFVVHSMGGLVVKKAYILGCHDPQYQDIVKTVRSIVFLATPHRGSGLADILKRFLQISTQSPKQYVSDLQKDSARIRDINDQFRLHAPRLQIVSFFETLQTAIGPKKMVVVERESAILDYPDEISCPLTADHHSVCKYTSPQDSNYVSVRNVLNSMATKFKSKATFSSRISSRSHISAQEGLSQLLKVDDWPAQDLERLLERCASDSCQWILACEDFRAWIEGDLARPTFLHITGPPGSGKSVLAAFLISDLETSGRDVQYFFFRHDDHVKRSIRHCILSLAFQIALRIPAYRRRLVALLDERDSILKSDARMLWQKLISGLLPKVALDHSLVWIIDALDESESTQLLLSLFQSLAQQNLALRILILSRPHTIVRPIERLRSSLHSHGFYQVSMAAPEASIRFYISQELQYTHWSTELKQQVITSLLTKSTGNFLWLHLVMRELIECDTKAAVERTLLETPFELSEVYHRIERSLSADLRSGDKRLAKALFSWVTCSERQLSLDELKEALQPEHPVLDLKHTIGKLCGDFVFVDRTDRVSMIHHTAKEFLLQSSSLDLSIDLTTAHQMLFSKCLDVLLDPKFRYRLRSSGCKGFLRYACVSWSYHLAKAGVLDRTRLNRLASFFRGQSVLAWINSIGLVGELKILTNTAKALTAFLEKRERADSEHNPLAQPLQEIELCNQWASELVRIVGKFGSHLLAHPQAIYTLIPLFCPPESVTNRFFSSKDPLAPRVSGILGTGWDDSLAKFSIGNDCQPTQILCLQGHFAILATDESVNLYHYSTFQEARRFTHNELIVAIAVDQGGKYLATCGPRTIKLWALNGQMVQQIDNPRGVRAISVTFSNDSTSITICCDDSSLWVHPLDPADYAAGWTKLYRELQDDPFFGSGRGTPVCTAFSPDGSQIAIAFRGIPLCVWGVEHGQLIGRCERTSEKGKSRRDLWSYAQRLTWNPITEHIVGIYNDGCVFKWYPLDSESEEVEVPVVATEIACSPDGRFVVTASGNGSLRVWNFDNFSLLYHLACTSSVTDMAISLDGRRIYDLRESHCNIWEPNALIRLAEADEKASETSSSHAGSVTMSLVSEASATILEPITALAASRDSLAYCACNDGGLFTCVLDEGNKMEVSLGYMGVTKLAWSDDNSMIATAELDGSVNVRSALRDNPLEKLLEGRSENPIQQLLFVNSNSALLARCSELTTVWSLRTKSVAICRPAGSTTVEWIQHPSNPMFLLAINPRGITLHSAEDLSPQYFWKFDQAPFELSDLVAAPFMPEGPQMSPSGVADVINIKLDKVFTTPDKTELIIEASVCTEGGNRTKQFMLLSTQLVIPLPEPKSKPVTGSQSSIEVRPLPMKVLSQIEMSLGFIDDDLMMATHRARPTTHTDRRRFSLVFLDHEFWVCTWSMSDSEGENVRRHFFLPRDWVNMDCLELALVTQDGRFLCPKNGEVAVVSNGFRQEWVD